MEQLPKRLARLERRAQSVPRPVRSRLGLAWLFGCLLLAAGVAWGGGNPDSAQQTKPRTKRIEEVRPGEYVLAKGPRTGQVARKKVLEVFRREVDHLRHLEIEGADGVRQTIETTDEHPFFLEGGEVVPADELAPGDRLEQEDGQCAVLISTCYEPRPNGVAVYNLHVEDFHTYYVAAQGARAPPVWVHNTQTCLAVKGAIHKHHPLPKFLGGDRLGQTLSRLDAKVHREFHDVLKENLRKADIHLSIGGRGGGKVDWANFMKANPGAQRKAFDAVLQASRSIDAKHGTTIVQDVWNSIFDQKYTPFP